MCIKTIIAFAIATLPVVMQLKAQDSDSPLIINELGFVQHLIRYKQTDDALFVLQQLRRNPVFSGQSDTLDFLLGNIYMSQRNLDSSFAAYKRVRTTANFFTESSFFASLSAMYLKEYCLARNSLSAIPLTDSNIRQLWLTEKAGLALLEREKDTFLHYSSLFTYDWYPVKIQQKELQENYLKIKAFRDKSPALAGILSAAVPGLGKVYSKRYGDGASAFLINLSLGLLTWENYRKDGILDAKTLIFGSIFSIFYVGNIWGSVYSVKMYRDDFNDVIDEQILYNLHVPLRAAYQ